MAEAKLCVVCAWRENCQKKYSISKQAGANCPDFSRDLSLPTDPEPQTSPVMPRRN
jgi:hypothetical protein